MALFLRSCFYEGFVDIKTLASVRLFATVRDYFKGDGLDTSTLQLEKRFEPRQNTKDASFVGVRPHPLKYDHIWGKRTMHTYGIQGTNHLLPQKGQVILRKPVKMLLKKDKIYAWCSCGFSNNQPLCDGSHNRSQTELKPVRYIPDKDMEVFLCGCKQTNNRPFCDGSHKTIVDTPSDD